MRTILFFLSFLLVSPSLSFGNEEVLEVPLSSSIFHDYFEAADYARQHDKPFVVVVFSMGDSGLLGEVVSDASFQQWLGYPIDDIAVLAVLYPTEENPRCVVDFMAQFPEVDFSKHDQDALCSAIVLNDSSELLLLTPFPRYLFDTRSF